LLSQPCGGLELLEQISQVPVALELRFGDENAQAVETDDFHERDILSIGGEEVLDRRANAVASCVRRERVVAADMKASALDRGLLVWVKPSPSERLAKLLGNGIGVAVLVTPVVGPVDVVQ
jgi:hypothetical protein